MTSSSMMSEGSSKTRRATVIALLSLSVISTISVVALVLSSQPSGSVIPRLAYQKPAPSLGLDPDTSALSEERERRKSEKVMAKVRKDPQYGRNLLLMTEESVMAMPGFSDAEKRAIWQRIKASQTAARNALTKP